MTAQAVNEPAVRAAAGLTLALVTVAFALAALDQEFVVLRVATVLLFVEFSLRVFVGFRRSPFGALGTLLAAGQQPIWVAAPPKRFAWSLGLVLAGTMAVLTNLGVTGWVPFVMCSTCITLMWLEAVLGLCLGCAVYARLVRWGLAQGPCADGHCAIPMAQLE